MSSSTRSKSLFTVEAGVVHSEEPKRVSEEGSVTITVVAKDKHAIRTILADLILAQSGHRCVFRWSIVAPPVAVGASERRVQQSRVREKIAAPHPGFDAPEIGASGEACFAIARAVDPARIDIDHLSDYRRTVLIATDREEDAAAIGVAVSQLRPPIDATAIATIRRHHPSWGVIRTLDLDTHAELQLVWPLPQAAGLIGILEEMGLTKMRPDEDLLRVLREGQVLH